MENYLIIVVVVEVLSLVGAIIALLAWNYTSGLLARERSRVASTMFKLLKVMSQSEMQFEFSNISQVAEYWDDDSTIFVHYAILGNSAEVLTIALVRSGNKIEVQLNGLVRLYKSQGIGFGYNNFPINPISEIHKPVAELFENIQHQLQDQLSGVLS